MPADLPVPLARVLAALSEGLLPVPGRRLALSEAEGAVLAAPLVVPGPVPAEAVALRRGFAVLSADTIGAGPYSPLALPAVPAMVEPGEHLPLKTDAVLPADAVEIAGNRAEALESASPGLWARRIGEDAAAGAVLRNAGEVLRGIDIAVARAASVSSCEVRRPRILLAGGDAASAGPAQLLAGLARAAGAEVIWREADGLRPDLILAFDLGALLDRGATILAPRLALCPGESGAVLRLGAVPVIVAPDRLADALGVWLALGLPLVRSLARAGKPPRLAQPLARKISSTIGMAEIALLRTAGTRFEPVATGDLPLAAITGADAWTIVPPESEGFAAGEAVSAERFTP